MRAPDPGSFNCEQKGHSFDVSYRGVSGVSGVLVGQLRSPDVPMSRCRCHIWHLAERFACVLSFTQTFRPDGTLYHFILSKRRHLSKLSEMRKSFYMRLLESIILHVVGQHVEAA